MCSDAGVYLSWREENSGPGITIEYSKLSP